MPSLEKEIADALNEIYYSPGDGFSQEETIGAEKALAIIAPLFEHVATAVAYAFSERSQEARCVTWDDREKAITTMRQVLKYYATHH